MASALNEESIKKIIRQVEFYFSDSNLPRDKFLRTTVEESEDGLVSLGLICSFSRMKMHLGLGGVKADEVPEETVQAVAEVLRTSSSLRVSEDGKKIGRSTKLLKPEDVIEQVNSRTVAASPLPYDVKLEDVQAFFGEKAKVNSVRLPRHIGDRRAFCGTALIEFSDEDDAKKILQEKLIYAGADLELKPKNEFDVEREQQREVVKKNRSSMDRSNKDSSNGSYPKGLIVSYELKLMATAPSTKQNDSEIVKGVEVNDTKASKSSKSEKATENTDHEEKSSENIVEEGKANADDLQNEEKADIDSSQKNEIESDKDLLIDDGNKHAGSADHADVVTREDLKEVFKKFGIVKYIDFKMGEESGFVRFEEPEAAVKARACSVLAEEGGLVVKKKYIATLQALTGEAERDYWKKVGTLRGNKDKVMESKSYRGRGRHNNNRGGRHFDGKRSRDAGFSGRGRPNKARKV